MNPDLKKYEEAVLERICSVCMDRRHDGTCGLDPNLECAVRVHLPEIIGVVRSVSSDNAGDYVERLRDNICTVCSQSESDASCDVREQVNCALDRYFGLVIEAIEEVDQREGGVAGNDTP